MHEKQYPKGKSYVMGVDSGSLTAKAVVMDTQGRLIAHHVIQLGFVSKEALQQAVDLTLEDAGLTMEDIGFIVATGYGRLSYEPADLEITEISCHARGAHYMVPQVKTVIDIGGQDSKVISVGKNGRFVNFAMNEKCAAGTGKFIQVMSNALGVKLEEVGELSLLAEKELHISNTCTVFAETEVISLVAQNEKQADILAGIHASVASRMVALVSRVGIVAPVVMTGGVAQNVGLVQALERALGISITVPDHPQLAGAIGAACFALDRLQAVNGET